MVSKSHRRSNASERPPGQWLEPRCVDVDFHRRHGAGQEFVLGFHEGRVVDETGPAALKRRAGRELGP